jgi:hypothetical protein
MLWTPLRIVAPAAGSSSNASSGVRLIAVDPWTHGIVDLTGHNTYLSFPNAINAIVEQIGMGAPAALGIAVTATNLASLSANITQLGAAFPLPNMQRLARRATALQALESSKFNLVPYGHAESSVNMSSLPSVRALRRADLLKSASDNATAFLSSNPATNISSLQSDKTAHAATVAGAQAAAGAGLTGTPAGCWRFYAEGNIASSLLAGSPGHEYTLTAIMLFMGSIADLALLKTIFPYP